MSELALPEGWVKAKINDVSIRISQKKPDDSDEFFYVDISSINRETKKINNPNFISGTDAPSRARKIIAKGDVIVSLTRPNLNAVALVDEKYDGHIASTGFEVIRPVLVESGYIFEIVRSFDFVNKLSRDVQGALYPAAKSSDVQGYEIPLPPLSEQKVIAHTLNSYLTTVSQIQARLDAIPKLIEKFRQSVLSNAVSGKVICNDEDKFKLVSVENTWKHDVIGLNHWKQYRLSEVINFIGGSQPPKSEFINEPCGGYIRLIQIRDYKTDKYKAYIPIEKARRLVNKNEIMIGRYGPPIFQILRGLEGAYNVALMKAEPKNDNLDIEFLYYYLQNYKLYNYIESASDRTAGQSGVNKKHLEGYPILLPPLDEQLEIVSRVKVLLEHANQIEKSVATAKARVDHLTQSILHQAFTGNLTAEWREQNPELITGDNSAEALLAKIKAEKQGSGKKKSNKG